MKKLLLVIGHDSEYTNQPLGSLTTIGTQIKERRIVVKQNV